MFWSFFWFSILSFMIFGSSIARGEDTIEFGNSKYPITDIVVSKSSSARLARLDENDPEILRRHIYLPAGTVLFLLDRFERDPRRYQLAVSEHGMPLYLLKGVNYLPAIRFAGMVSEYAAIPRDNIIIESEVYGTITLTPSEVYSMEFLDYPQIAIAIGQAKMGKLYTEDDIVTVKEDQFAYVALPIIDGALPPTPTQVYNFNSALDDILKGIANEDGAKLQRFKDYASGRFVSRKECEDEINYGLDVTAELVAEFDTWLSPVEAKLGLTGNYQATRKYAAGTEFTVERYNINGRIYELKDESVAENCVSLKENRRIRMAAGRVIAQLNTEDASELLLRTDPKGRIIYTCRDEYLKIEKTLSEQELRVGPARLLISRFTVYEDVTNAARCVSAN